MDKHLHIVSFIVPYPVNYGGVYDIYYKLIELHRSGIKIHLHCFTENNNEQSELNKYCEEVQYYPRKKGVHGMSFMLPYIVSSRRNKKLLDKLSEDDYPVLMEGIHSSALLLDKKFTGRKTVLRLHNVEHHYYAGLLATTSSVFKKLYYGIESFLLKKYEQRIAAKPSLIVAVAQQDINIYRQNFFVQDIQLLPVFTGFKEVSIPSSKGNFCLYHGNLSVSENEKAVEWLLSEIFSTMDIPLVIAGKSPSIRLVNMIGRFRNARLIANPSDTQLKDIIVNTQCHVLPSFNSTGIKLKLINALFNGRHCIVNSATVKNSPLEQLCFTGDSSLTFRNAVTELFYIPVSIENIRKRKIVLEEIFNDHKNCDLLIQWIW